VFAQKGKLFSSPLQAAGHSNGVKDAVKYYDRHGVLKDIVDEYIDLSLEETLKTEILKGKRKRSCNLFTCDPPHKFKCTLKASFIASLVLLSSMTPIVSFNLCFDIVLI